MKILNGTDTVYKISDFKGKLLILDFWATWCTPCRLFFKLADSLNKEFAGKLEILPVTYEDSSVVGPFIRAYRKFTGIELATAYKDVGLNKTFFHRIIPHEVWIDTAGKVIAITNSFDVNKENIMAVLSGKMPNFLMKDEAAFIKVDNEKPVLLGKNKVAVPDSLVVYHKKKPGYEAVLTKFYPKFTSVGANGEDFYHTLNTCPAQIYLWAAGEFKIYTDSRIIITSKDSAKIYPPTDPWKGYLWMREYGYCYEFMLTDSSLRKKKFKLAVDCLNEYFGKHLGIEGKAIKKKTFSYVLEKMPNFNAIKDSIRSKGGEPYRSDNIYSLNYRNVYFSDFVLRMKSYYFQLLKYPLIDKTGLGSDKVDIQITGKLNDIDTVNKELKRYGLTIIKRKKRLTYVLIRDLK